ncbi:probable receptor-like protein kinase At2g42960 [Vicia villosa]|uniref:probable receptor-like protein kinase At2g42960 n=1 Tax=Vicia villosa TaxID=3911 RepID=UPI00273CC6D1|nr:probable receptor-like protein kinase At2g42960 [Vicia villosa]
MAFGFLFRENDDNNRKTSLSVSHGGHGISSKKLTYSRTQGFDLVWGKMVFWFGSGSVGGIGPEVAHLGWGRWYTLRELEDAIGGFRPENVLGEGGYGIVYHGVLTDGTKVDVKNLLNNKMEMSSLGCTAFVILEIM